MNEEDIRKLVDGDPDVLINKMAEYGIDFSGLDKDIARIMVKEQFSLTDNEFDAVDFVFWMSYFVERTAEELIIDPQVAIGAPKRTMESVVSKLHFGEKIKVMEELYVPSKDTFLKLMRKVQDLRNEVAHGRFNNLKYGGYHLNDNRGKMKLLADLRDSLRKKSI